MASKLLKNGTIITFDEAAKALKVLPKASLLIENDRIAAIESDLAKITIPSDCEIIDVEGQIVSPGFINTHMHSWQSVYRTLGPNVFLSQYLGWLSQASPQVAAVFKPEDVYVSALQGYLEGLNGGTTTFVEHAHSNWSREVVVSGYEAAVDVGARVWWCYDLLARPGFGDEEQWRVLAELAGRKEPLVPLGVSVDGALMSGEAAVEKVKEMSRELKLEALTTHHLGGPWPINNGPQRMLQTGLTTLNIPIILSHASHLTSSDISILEAENIFAAITPESELSYGHGQTTGHLITPNASLGVDTAHSYSGDMHLQARLWLQYTRDRLYQACLDGGKIPNANPFRVEEAFLLATRQGGLALRRDDLGVLKVGAKADVVVWDGGSPSMLGWTDAVAAVILHANSADVRHVFVEGEWRKRDFGLLDGRGMGMEVLKERFVEASRRIQGQMVPAPALGEKLWGVGEFGDVGMVSTKRES